MASNFKIVHTGVGPWKHGEVVSKEMIESDKQKRLGGVDRLKRLGGIEETSDPVRVGAHASADPNSTKGDNVDPGSGDTVDKRADRRTEAVGDVNNGKRTSADVGTPLHAAGGDAAGVANPATGGPGDVQRVTGKRGPGGR